ncbi:MAG: DUF4038 domain-containing protein [Anaerolineae bacterium]|nr:DUF4038 domain-containing protein [Anaerolineae bacterium]
MTGENAAAAVFPQAISADRRGFADRQGRPFFWLGDTAWPLFTQVTRAEAEAYLADRAQKGFTVIQGVIAWFGGDRPDPSGLSPNEYGHYPWLDGDPARPNPDFFAHVDALLDIAEAHGLTLAILPTWGNFVTDTQILNADNARVYGRWLAERYRARPNLVWINGGDCLPHGYEAVFDALAGGLREGDGGAHLITYHPCALHSAAQYFSDRDWLDFSMIQTWTDWHKTYDSLISDGLTGPARPIVLGEGAYEDGPEYARGPITPLVVRRQAWWTFAAGGYFTYGQNQMWRAQPGWTSTFDTPGARQMGIFRQIAAALPWWDRLPDQTLIEEGIGGGETLNAAVRGSDGRWALVYLSSRCHALIRLERLASEFVRAVWANPATGQRLDAGTHRAFTLPGVRQVRQSCFAWFRTPDFWEDAVLILHAADAPIDLSSR